MKTILTFGHIPKHAGGKQSSGLSNVMWSLALAMNNVNSNYTCAFAATDINENIKVIDGIKVFGWCRLGLAHYIIINPFWFIYYIGKAAKLLFHFRLSFFSTFGKLIFYHKILDEVEPDLIHLHGCTSVVHYELYQFNRRKVFATVHGISGHDENIVGYLWNRKMERRFNRLNFIFVSFISSAVASQWGKYYPGSSWKSVVIPNSFDKNIYYYDNKIGAKIKNSTLYNICTIGSIGKLKGQERVLLALFRINSNYNFVYSIVGNGTSDAVRSISQLANTLGVSIKLHGYMAPPKIRELLHDMDFMVLPSSSEGFGLVFLESIASGVPVVLPKNLPIAQEKGLLNKKNSILIDDSSIGSLEEFFNNIHSFTFDPKQVSESIKDNSWENVARTFIGTIDIALYRVSE